MPVLRDAHVSQNERIQASIVIRSCRERARECDGTKCRPFTSPHLVPLGREHMPERQSSPVFPWSFHPMKRISHDAIDAESSPRRDPTVSSATATATPRLAF